MIHHELIHKRVWCIFILLRDTRYDKWQKRVQMIYFFLLIHSKYIQKFKHHSSGFAYFSPFSIRCTLHCCWKNKKYCFRVLNSFFFFYHPHCQLTTIKKSICINIMSICKLTEMNGCRKTGYKMYTTMQCLQKWPTAMWSVVKKRWVAVKK